MPAKKHSIPKSVILQTLRQQMTWGDMAAKSGKTYTALCEYGRTAQQCGLFESIFESDPGDPLGDIKARAIMLTQDIEEAIKPAEKSKSAVVSMPNIKEISKIKNRFIKGRK